MIEAYNRDGVQVLINPQEVIEVYRGETWCNVVLTNGATHRFQHAEARRVFEALRAPVRLGDD